MKTILTLGVNILILNQILLAQNYPWPQNITYSYGFKPSAETQAAMTTRAQNGYTQWKADFVTTINAGGYRRVKYPQASNFTYTASEGIGYGMLLAAYSADKALVDDLFNYFNLKKNPQGLMNWRTDYNGNCSGGDCYSATDGDEDIAFALLIAHCQWGSGGTINYLQQAINLINKIMQYEVDLPSGRLRPGEFFGGAHCVDPSYFLVAYFPYFKIATGNANWDLVKAYCLNYFNTVGHTTSGLFRDWSKDDGTVPGVNGGDDCSWRESNYAYDAARIPWRLANDYLWHGTTVTRDAARKMVTWTRTSTPVNGTAANFRDCLNWNGSGNCGTNSNNPIVGGMSVGAMALDNTVPANVTYLNNLYTENNSRNDDWFYNRSLKLIYQFVQSGNFWPPYCIAAMPVELINFEASRIDAQQLEIHWAATEEKNCKAYIVEKSYDGFSFHKIRWENAGEKIYSITDNDSYAGKLFYRLKEVSTDESESQLALTVVQAHALPSTITILQNPISQGSAIKVEGSCLFDKPVAFEIFSIAGDQIIPQRVETKNSGGIELHMPQLPAGLYLLKIKIGNEEVQLKKVMIQ